MYEECYRRLFIQKLIFNLALVLLLSFPHNSIGSIYLPQGDIVGSVQSYTVGSDDNLYKIARKFDVGIVNLLAANPGIDPWMPKIGVVLTLPTMHILPPVEHKGIVINLAELRLYYFDEEGKVMTFPVGIGKDGWETKQGVAAVIRKQKDPSWIPPDSIKEENPDIPDIIPAGPDNPLGQYALYLSWPSYLIHGTNRPYGIGKRSSHGCIRLYPEDIEKLFAVVNVGTKVTVIDKAYKLGWKDNALWFEVTPTQEQSDDIAEYEKPFSESFPEIYTFIQQTVGEDTNVNWYAVEEAIVSHNGMPVIIAEGRRNWQK